MTSSTCSVSNAVKKCSSYTAYSSWINGSLLAVSIKAEFTNISFCWTIPLQLLLWSLHQIFCVWYFFFLHDLSQYTKYSDVWMNYMITSIRRDCSRKEERDGKEDFHGLVRIKMLSQFTRNCSNLFINSPWITPQNIKYTISYSWNTIPNWIMNKRSLLSLCRNRFPMWSF